MAARGREAPHRDTSRGFRADTEAILHHHGQLDVTRREESGQTRAGLRARELGPGRMCSPRQPKKRDCKMLRMMCWAILARPCRERPLPATIAYYLVKERVHQSTIRVDPPGCRYREVGAGRYCSPRHRMPYFTINEA